MCQKISVIIPCFNAENTIVYSLQSLASQTYDNIEVIIVDDGSNDGTERVVHEFFLDKSLDYKYYRQENKGSSAARNVGIEKSNGEYICFLDADDYYDKSFIKRLYTSIRADNSDVAICRFRFVNCYNENNTLNNPQSVSIPSNSAIKKYLNRRSERLSFGGGMYKRTIIEQNEVYFPESKRYGEDAEFFLHYLSCCRNGASIIEDALYNYMVRNGSVSHERNYKRVQVIESIMTGLTFWENDKTIDENFRENAVSRAIWAIAKDFAMADVALLRKLEKDYNVRDAMMVMRKESTEKPVKYSSYLYLIHPSLFIYALRIFAKYGERK